jgi:hypothetical protein
LKEIIRIGKKNRVSHDNKTAHRLQAICWNANPIMAGAKWPQKLATGLSGRIVLCGGQSKIDNHGIHKIKNFPFAYFVTRK